MSLKKLQKEKDSTPPKGHGDVAEMVKILANTQPGSRQEARQTERETYRVSTSGQSIDHSGSVEYRGAFYYSVWITSAKSG